LFQGKPATSGDCFSFLVTYLGSLMLLTTFNTEPNPLCKQQSWLNIVLVHVLGQLFQVRIKFFGGKWSGWTIFPGILVPWTNFFRPTKISITFQKGFWKRFTASAVSSYTRDKMRAHLCGFLFKSELRELWEISTAIDALKSLQIFLILLLCSRREVRNLPRLALLCFIFVQFLKKQLLHGITFTSFSLVRSERGAHEKCSTSAKGPARRKKSTQHNRCHFDLFCVSSLIPRLECSLGTRLGHDLLWGQQVLPSK